MFDPVPPGVDFVELERSELDRWMRHRVFERSVSQGGNAGKWVFYEGPPTANGRPGLHHVWARVYKDLFCRFKTMRGFRVTRRAGWDTHGLPVEVEVEKRLGITGKRQIEEEVGIGEFTRLCRESVLSYVDDFKDLTTRIGYWVDFDDAYWTMSPAYVESVWWHLKNLYEQGLIYEDVKVVPYCPRCGTALSSHELGQPDVYSDEEDESAYVVLPIADPDESIVGDARALVVWTTTPWTLISNTGAAVNPDLTYAVVDHLILAEDLVSEVMGENATISHKVTGKALIGTRYERPFDDVPVPPDVDGWRVVGADFVTTDEGTGIVHLAPAFGEVDRQVARETDLPSLNPVGPDGNFDEQVPWLSGRPVRETNHDINNRLESKGLLLRRLLYTHSYPHCWRCGTALIYWGKPSWYIATSSRKADLIAQNAQIDWHPSHIRDGRFGEWLAGNVDWALSRDRFWGTPLPVWRCRDGHTYFVGSLDELSELAGDDLRSLDPHRPQIDRIEFPCPKCASNSVGGSSEVTAARVEPVIDAWFDSGAMPAAQVGYPHLCGSTEALEFPADFISEAIDQTRGWFYSLLAVNTLVFGSTPYRHVVCLGHIVDSEGRKMSKSLGNVIDPWDILDTRGADPLRWWMFSQGSPWTPTRASIAAIDTSMRDVLLTLWNSVSFFTTYASLNGFDPNDNDIPPIKERPALDRWMISRLWSAVLGVTDALEAYEPLVAATAIASLVDDISNWYVRRSRKRFWRTDPNALPEDTLAAQSTLFDVLVTVSTMLGPFCPFVADRIWREMTGADESDSVHLACWPISDSEDAKAWIDCDLEEQMDLARRLSSLGRAARSEAGVKVRQPLARALVFLTPKSPAILEDLVCDELNVDEVVVAKSLEDVLQFEIVPNFKLLGPRLGSDVKHVRGALAQIDGTAAAIAIESGESISVDLPSGRVVLFAEDVEVRVKGQPVFAVSRQGGEVVALDLTIDDELKRRGMAREVVRLVQELRKQRGLEVSDRITLCLEGADDIAPRFNEMANELLAVKITQGRGAGDGEHLDLGDGVTVRAWLEKV